MLNYQKEVVDPTAHCNRRYHCNANLTIFGPRCKQRCHVWDQRAVALETPTHTHQGVCDFEFSHVSYQ